MPLLEVANLSVRYDKAVILNGVSRSVDAGEFVGVVGPNGAGKTTLLRAISGLVRLEERMKRGTSGDIVLEGEGRFSGRRIDAPGAHEGRRRGLGGGGASRRSARCPAWPIAATCCRRARSSRRGKRSSSWPTRPCAPVTSVCRRPT